MTTLVAPKPTFSPTVDHGLPSNCCGSALWRSTPLVASSRAHPAAAPSSDASRASASTPRLLRTPLVRAAMSAAADGAAVTTATAGTTGAGAAAVVGGGAAAVVAGAAAAVVAGAAAAVVGRATDCLTSGAAIGAAGAGARSEE